MIRNLIHGLPKLMVALASTLWASQAVAQVDPANERRWNVADGNYETPGNWDNPDFSPPEGRFGEGAVIDNMGTANVVGVVDSAANPGTEATPGQLRIVNGTLNIQSAGQLRVVADATAPGPPLGAASVAGAGTLAKASGGVFEAESLSLGGALRLGITNTGLNAIDVANTATLGGTLQVDFTGFTPPSTGTWSLIEANSFGGSFATISATGVTLTASQVLTTRQTPLGGGRTSLELFIDQLLSLEVNRETGAVKMFSTGGSADIDSYTITSESGSLDDTDTVFNSLNEQIGSTWRESNTSANQVAELKQTGATSVNGTGFALGNVYSPPAPVAFRDQAAEGQDLVFSFSAPDGVVRTGLVEYIGDAPVNDLLVTVDPTDGRVELSNPSTFNVQIEGYTISSPDGDLVTSGWTSLDDSDGPGNDDGGWRESNASANFLGELLQTGAQMVNSGAKFQLGSIYDFAGGSEDLVFEFLLAGESVGLVGTVQYRELADPGSLLGDFNLDDVVDAADYTIWRDNLGGPASALNGNGSGGPTVTVDDYQLWKDHFGETAGSLSSVGASAVPEPGSAVSLVLCITMAMGIRMTVARR